MGERDAGQVASVRGVTCLVAEPTEEPCARSPQCPARSFAATDVESIAKVMETIIALVLAVACGYLCGSIPVGLITAKLVAGVDLRTVASGNIGATNVARVCGWKWALFVLALDAAKGALPAFFVPRVSHALFSSLSQRILITDLTVVVGLAAILGHMFPVWLGFRGGKGGATGLGVGAVLAPKAVLVAALLYVVIVAVTRYSSLGTLTGTLGYLVTYLATTPEPWGRTHRTVTVFLLLAAALIFVRHRANIGRLLRGQEHRLNFGRRATSPAGAPGAQEAGGTTASEQAAR